MEQKQQCDTINALYLTQSLSYKQWCCSGAHEDCFWLCETSSKPQYEKASYLSPPRTVFPQPWLFQGWNVEVPQNCILHPLFLDLSSPLWLSPWWMVRCWMTEWLTYEGVQRLMEKVYYENTTHAVKAVYIKVSIPHNSISTDFLNYSGIFHCLMSSQNHPDLSLVPVVLSRLWDTGLE